MVWAPCFTLLASSNSVIAHGDLFHRITNDDGETSKEDKPSKDDSTAENDGISNTAARNNKSRSEIKPGTYYSFSKKGMYRYFFFYQFSRYCVSIPSALLQTFWPFRCIPVRVRTSKSTNRA